MLEDLIVKIAHLWYRIRHARGSGYEKKIDDPRDFDSDDIGFGFGYKPKSDAVMIPTLSVKQALIRIEGKL